MFVITINHKSKWHCETYSKYYFTNSCFCLVCVILHIYIYIIPKFSLNSDHHYCLFLLSLQYVCIHFYFNHIPIKIGKFHLSSSVVYLFLGELEENYERKFANRKKHVGFRYNFAYMCFYLWVAPFHLCTLPLHQMPSSLSAFAFAHWDAFFYLCACLHPSRCVFLCVYLPSSTQVLLSMCVLASSCPGASFHVCTCLHTLRWFTPSLYLATHWDVSYVSVLASSLKI